MNRLQLRRRKAAKARVYKPDARVRRWVKRNRHDAIGAMAKAAAVHMRNMLRQPSIRDTIFPAVRIDQTVHAIQHGALLRPVRVPSGRFSAADTNLSNPR